ncbi:MAG: SDR family NAD(P)-dependent oxidoreductase [Longimicrobiales bacterium]|nr:SDR family NAD(P)-dependent oxidoreductase [Longimicrobiales bacterium]
MLITGATDGIGLALADLLDRRGERLVIVGRRALETLSEEARDLAKRHLYCRADLSRESAADTVTEFLRTHEVGALDRLVLNAAGGFHGGIAEESPDALRALVELNLASPIALTHALSPLLTAAGGRVVFVSSVVSSLPSPSYAVYSATKAALEGFARSLRTEVRGSFEVQVVRPGATRSGLHRKMGIERSTIDWTRFPAAEVTARRLLRAIDGPARDRTLGAVNTLIHLAGRLAPGLIEHFMRRSGSSLGTTPPAPAHPGDPRKPRCVITGAADGIGRALAIALAREGCTIVGIDRDASRAARTQAEIEAVGGEASFLEADLARASEIESVGEALAAGPPIDIVVHSAGISAVGRFVSLPLAAQRAVLDINFIAPLHLTTTLLRRNALSSAPHLVSLASLSCFTSYPGAAVYAASKDGLASWTRSLSAALGSAARVLTIHPGPVRTRHAERYSPTEGGADRRMPPEAVAEAIAHALRRRRRGTRIPGATNRAVAILGRLAPGLMEGIMKRVILDRLDEGGETSIRLDRAPPESQR